MTGKIEEVARAMDPELWGTVPSYKPPRAIEISREISISRARLSLEATKWPTDEMIKAACVADDHCTPPNVCEAIFNAMIDAALEEK